MLSHWQGYKIQKVVFSITLWVGGNLKCFSWTQPKIKVLMVTITEHNLRAPQQSVAEAGKFTVK